jgi:branched-subunit amino acid aminotransferase/4-amino-4-deoxychorismate lyase
LADPIMLAYLNGQFIPQEEARLSIDDAGFIFGATITDLCRTFRHRLFRLKDHVARFRQSCRLAHIPQPVRDEDIIQIAGELTARNTTALANDLDLVLVMFATPGPIGYYSGHESNRDKSSTFGMHMFPLPLDRYAPLFRRGVHLVVPSVRQAVTSTVDPRIKHRSRLHWWIASQEAQQIEESAWALLPDASGNITETAAANFLIVKDGVICTPPESTVLGGISLLTVEEICQELQLPFQERRLTVQDCLEADEALLTGTAFCVAGVSQLNGHSIPWPGKVFERLLDAWNKRVGLDVRAQILSAD